MQDTPDLELVERIRQGDQDAWASFLARYTDLIYGKACAYCRSSDGAEREDEKAELYLFMAALVRRSIKSYQGRCQPST